MEIAAVFRAVVASGAEFLAADGMHMNDRGYACLALALGRSIAAAVRSPPG